MPASDLRQDQMDLVRQEMRELLARPDWDQTRLAKELGYKKPSQVSRVTAKGSRAGVSFAIAQKVAAISGKSLREFGIAIDDQPAAAARTVVLDERFPEHARRLRLLHEARKLTDQEFSELMKRGPKHEGDYDESGTTAAIREYRAEVKAEIDRLVAGIEEEPDPELAKLAPPKKPTRRADRPGAPRR